MAKDTKKDTKKFTFEEALKDLENEYREDGSDVSEIVSVYEQRKYALEDGEDDEDDDELEFEEAEEADEDETEDDDDGDSDEK